MLPHEKELVERLKNKPFALIGINTDPVDTFKNLAGPNGISWRNVLAGKTGGPVVQAYSVRKYPTIYVLDAKGVIRFIDVRGELLDQAVDLLLRELEAKPEPKPDQHR